MQLTWHYTVRTLTPLPLAHIQGKIKFILFKAHECLASNTKTHHDMLLSLLSDISLFKEGYFVCRMQRAEH